jgi:hypothetical protein
MNALRIVPGGLYTEAKGYQIDPFLNQHNPDQEDCPNCGTRMIWLHCELKCHCCGIKFTCDE